MTNVNKSSPDAYLTKLSTAPAVNSVPDKYIFDSHKFDIVSRGWSFSKNWNSLRSSSGEELVTRLIFSLNCVTDILVFAKRFDEWCLHEPDTAAEVKANQDGEQLAENQVLIRYLSTELSEHLDITEEVKDVMTDFVEHGDQLSSHCSWKETTRKSEDQIGYDELISLYKAFKVKASHLVTSLSTISIEP
ncbi:MAG: hypothetical protein TREMPRED_001630 [Tremellales sp. Tagirdzhanova-0007]|nr:MAG: hypothetical protein TREMPRED_001630 [Tremellales sp. Tagirdzhanova-0007]